MIFTNLEDKIAKKKALKLFLIKLIRKYRLLVTILINSALIVGIIYIHAYKKKIQKNFYSIININKLFTFLYIKKT